MISKYVYTFIFTCFGLGIQAQTVDADTLKTFTKEANTAYSAMKIQPLITRQVNGQNLGEVLQLMSSVFIKSNGPGGISTISLRGGSASQTQVFWEGIAINSPTLGQSDLSLLPSEFFSFVNINHSGASSQYGLGGIAGSLDMRSRGAYSIGGEVMFKKEVGSFGYDNTSAKVTLANNSRVFSETVLIKKSADNNFEYRDYSDPSNPMTTRANNAFSQLGIQENIQFKTNKGRIKLIANYLDTERGIPVAIGVQDQGQSQVDKNLKTSIQYTTSHAVQGDGEEYRAYSHKANLGFIHDYQNYKNVYADINSTYDISNLTAQFHSEFELKRKITLNTQINEYLYRAESAGFSSLKFQNNLIGFASLSKKWASTFVRLNLQEILIDEQLSPIIANLGAYQFFSIFSKQQKIFANGGTNYRHPTLNELYWSPGGNENLNPEQSINYEIGLRSTSSYSNDPFEYSITFFQDWVNNWIQWMPSTSGIWSPENVKSVQKTGLEGMLLFRKRYSDEKYILLTSNYRWVNAAVGSSLVSSEEVGKQLIYSPEHVLNLDGTIRLNKWSFRYNQTITSKFYLDRENLTYLPYSAPANIKVGYSYKEAEGANKSYFDVELTVHNIWDEEYQIVANQPMPGRWISLSLTYRIFNDKFGRKDL